MVCLLNDFLVLRKMPLYNLCESIVNNLNLFGTWIINRTLQLFRNKEFLLISIL